MATHTITLQEQLFHKDIPFLKEILPYEFKAEVFKGRHNYLCLRRWNELVQRRGSQLDLTGDFDQLSRWVNETATGDYSEAPWPYPGSCGWRFAVKKRAVLRSCAPIFPSAFTGVCAIGCMMPT